MGDVDDPHHAKNEAQAHRDEKHQRGVGNPVEGRENGDVEVHGK
jgi:hypothetical protein